MGITPVCPNYSIRWFPCQITLYLLGMEKGQTKSRKALGGAVGTGTTRGRLERRPSSWVSEVFDSNFSGAVVIPQRTDYHIL